MQSSASVPHDAGSHLELLYQERKDAKSRTNGNLSSVGSPEIDELIRKQAMERDPQKRLGYMTEAFAKIRELRPYIPLFQPAVIWAWREGIETPVDPLNRVFLDDVKLK